MNPTDDGALGHYRTSAAALAFMGVLGLGFAAVATVAGLDFRFIDSDAMMGFSLLYLVTALGMAIRWKG